MGERIDIVLSEEQREGTASTLSRWVIAAGAPVRAHEPVAEIETDKVVVELAAPVDGVLVECLKEEGDAVTPGEVIGRIEPGETAQASQTSPTTEPDRASKVAPVAAESAAATAPKSGAPAAGSRRFSPSVRRLLAEHGLAAEQITGTGRGGRVTADDVLAHARQARVADGHSGASRHMAHSAMRKRIAEHMSRSLLQEAPHVTSVFEADLSSVVAHRKAHRADFEARGQRLTLTAYYIAAAAAALRAVPEANARFHPESLEIFADINIGVGTALGDEGLIVPVIRRVQDLDLAGIAHRLTDLTDRARAGRLTPEEVRGGTFTISNHGVGGSLLAAPIVINQPQVAILGLGKVQKRVVVREIAGADEVAIRPMCFVTLSIDHRALDAFQTNRFLSVFVEALENWR